MAIQILCDECGKPIGRDGEIFVTGTGRVLIDGVDNNMQSAALCGKHKPDKMDWYPGDYKNWQPRNCTHVSFVYNYPTPPGR